jgi:tetratricopeptide (TPR) repeat protein
MKLKSRPDRGRQAAIDPAAFLRGLDEAAAHFAAGRLDAAAQVYRRLEREAPSDVRASYSLAIIDIRQGRLSRARSRLEAVSAQKPEFEAAWHNLGAVRQNLNDWPGAADAYERALVLQPQAVETRHALAIALAIVGKTAGAIAHHRELARDSVRRFAALTRIALLDAAAIGDDDLAEMRRGADGQGTDIETRIGLFFALGEVLERRGEDEAAFDAFEAGNRLKRASLATPPDVAAAANAAAAQYVMSRITADVAVSLGDSGDRSAAPIFIVGMPRSGSTLIEQILASHSAVQALGETAILPNLLADGYPYELKPAGLRALAARYLDAMRERGWDGRSRFVDKTLENYLHLGLIRLMFPRATILHCVRDPMDTGLSCYRQLFASGNETLYDLGDIGAEYVRYRTLMDHWRAVLTNRAQIDVDYETLVTDPDTRIPALVTEAASLAWDSACLRFFERAGPVRTASAAQVRRPIYRGAVQRWRRYEPRLTPLIAALRSGGVDF